MLRSKSRNQVPLSFFAQLMLPIITIIGSLNKQRRHFRFYFFASPAFLISTGVSLTVTVVSLIIYIWQVRIVHNNSPRSQISLEFAVVATIFFIMSVGSYSFKKRLSHKRAVGQLNVFLQWHICFAVIAVVTAAVHSFGHFQLITGTLAFWSLVLLTLSGFIGRGLDQVLPRLIANEVTKTLTLQGEDVITAVSQRVQYIARQGQRPSRNVLQFILYGDAQAVRREQGYRHIIRYWRIIHITIFILTVVFICWHLLFVAEVMFGIGG